MSESLTEHLFGTQPTTPTPTTTNNTNVPPPSNLFDTSVHLPQQPRNFTFRPPRSSPSPTTNQRVATTIPSSHNDPSPQKNETQTHKHQTTEEEEERTVFVGNLPLDTTRKALISLFKSCGKVVSARLRSVPTAGVKVAPEYAGNQNLVKKVSANTHQLLTTSPKTTSQGYVVFQSPSSIPSALLLNNTTLPTHPTLHLRVDHARPTLDPTRSVFIGNLKYGAEESTLRRCFLEGCGWEEDGGEVCGIRLVRDRETYSCKGFGYVLLRDRECVSKALEVMDQILYMDRPLRVRVCGTPKQRKSTKPKLEPKSKLEGKERRLVEQRKGEEERGKKTQTGRPRWKPHEKEERKNRTTTRSMTAPVATRSRRKRAKKPIVAKATAGKRNGVSKRAVTGKKRDKKIAKLQKRMVKGMGKTKKKS